MYYHGFYGLNEKRIESIPSDFLLLDAASGDVFGKDQTTKVLLVGKQAMEDNPNLYDSLRIIVNEGGKLTVYPIPKVAGYNPKLTLRSVVKKGTDQILVTVDSGGSGGIIYANLYSLLNGEWAEIFNSEDFYTMNTFSVTYLDQYKVAVTNVKTSIQFIIDISLRDPSYLNEIYDSKGNLLKPLEGFVNPIGGAYLVDTNGDSLYELELVQGIKGKYNADTLGYLNTILRYRNGEFIVVRQTVGVLGTDL